MQLFLYTTAGCHLCEIAYDLLQPIVNSSAISINLVEIGDDDTLTARYGVRIPVLQFPDGEELNWPFSEQDILRKIS